MRFEATEPTPGAAGHVTLWSNGGLVGEGDMSRTAPVAFSSCAGTDIGHHNGLVVDRDEDNAPYAVTGTVHEVVFGLKPARVEAEKTLHAHAAMQANGQGSAD